MTKPDRPNIVIAGGGVAGLEACLALRSSLGERDLSIDLLCREHRVEFRPQAVLEPFGGEPPWSLELERFAADQDVRLVRDTLAAVEPDRHEAITAYSGRLSYDALLVCVGARAVRALPGAITFRGSRDAAAVRAALDAMAPDDGGTIAFAVPFGAFWTLPAATRRRRWHASSTRTVSSSSPGPAPSRPTPAIWSSMTAGGSRPKPSSRFPTW